jgi:hypothetical protein
LRAGAVAFVSALFSARFLIANANPFPGGTAYPASFGGVRQLPAVS